MEVNGHPQALTVLRRYQLNRRLVGPHSRSEPSGEKKIFLSRESEKDFSASQRVAYILSRLSYHTSLFLWRCDPTRAMASSFLRFLDHTRRITVGMTHLGKWSARRRDLYLTTQNTHNQTNINAPGGIRTHDLSRRAAADLRLRPRGQWDRHHSSYST